MALDEFKTRCYGNGVVDRTSCTTQYNPVKEKIKLIRLRYHLAAEGCPDSQLSLARSLLEDVDGSEHDRSENSELAVRWLLMAAEEGHTEAQNLLEKCFHAGVGITYRNRERVENCLKSGDHEKLARHVGSTILRMMTCDTQDEVPLNFFVLKINSLLKGGVVSDLTMEDMDDQRVTVKDVVDAVLQCLQSESPKLHLHEQQIYRSNSKLWHPILRLFMLVLCYCQKMQAEFCTMEISFGILSLFIVVTTVSFWDSLLYRTCLCSFSFSVLLCITAKVLHMNTQYINALKWQQTINLVKHDEIFVEPKRPLAKEIFLYFVFAVMLFLFSGTFSSSISPSILSFSFVFTSSIIILLVRHSRISKLTTFSWLGHVLLAAMTYCSLTFPDFGFCEYLFLKVNFFGVVFSVNLLLICTVFLLLPFPHFKSRYEGILHAMSLIWVRIFVLLLMSCDFLQVFLFTLCTLITAKGISISLSVCLFLFLDALLMQGSFETFLVFAAFFAFGYISRKFDAKVFLLALLPMLWFLPSETPSEYVLDWDQYADVCYKTSDHHSNTARIQDVCSRFRNTPIMFEGTVSRIEQLSSQNVLQSAVSVFPFSCHLRCLMGESYEKCQSKECDLLRRVGECPCHLEKWGSTIYRLLVSIKTTFRVIGEVDIHLTGDCRNLVYSLREGDVVLVKGLLKEGLGMDVPRAHLSSAKCLSCVENVSCNLVRPHTAFWRRNEFIANAARFFLGPFIVVEKPV